MNCAVRTHWQHRKEKSISKKLSCSEKRRRRICGSILKNKEKMHEVTWKGGIVMMNLLEGLMGLLWKGAKYLLVAIVVFYVLLLITAW